MEPWSRRPRRPREGSGGRRGGRGRRRGGRGGGGGRPDHGLAHPMPARRGAPSSTPARAAAPARGRRRPGPTAPLDELVEIVRELAAARPNGSVLIDTLARTLKERGFSRPPNSPRLITRLRRIHELAVSRTGMITLVGVSGPAGRHQQGRGPRGGGRGRSRRSRRRAGARDRHRRRRRRGSRARERGGPGAGRAPAGAARPGARGAGAAVEAAAGAAVVAVAAARRLPRPPDPRGPRHDRRARVPHLVYRHTAATRLTHWITVLCLLSCCCSAGCRSSTPIRRSTGASESDVRHAVPRACDAIDSGDGELRGVTEIGGRQLRHHRRARRCRTTTASRRARGFPAWMTLPSSQRSGHGPALALLLRLAVRASTAWSICVYALVSGHVRRDLVPDARASCAEHRHVDPRPRAAAASPGARRHSATTSCRSSPISAVIFVLLPLMVLTGLTMSPGMDARLPRAARHLRRPAVGAHHPLPLRVGLIVLFVVVHVFMVLVSGVVEQPALDDHRPLRDRAAGGHR